MRVVEEGKERDNSARVFIGNKWGVLSCLPPELCVMLPPAFISTVVYYIPLLTGLWDLENGGFGCARG